MCIFLLHSFIFLPLKGVTSVCIWERVCIARNCVCAGASERVWVFVCACSCVCMWMDVCVCACACASLFACEFLCVHNCAGACVYVNVNVCVCVCVCVWVWILLCHIARKHTSFKKRHGLCSPKGLMRPLISSLSSFPFLVFLSATNLSCPCRNLINVK